MNNLMITLIATSTIDHISFSETGKQLQRLGGPGLYCNDAIKANGVGVSTITSEHPTDVYISVEENKERIHIPKISPIILTPDLRLPSRYILLSPILNEFDLNELQKYDCEIFLDAQGYIRGEDIDTCKFWSCDIENLKKVTAVKVNSRELNYVDPKIIDNLRQRILIITKGVNGVELWHKGRKNEFTTSPLKVTDTLGAGDTFFGAFVALFLKTQSVKDSIQEAIRYTTNFLTDRRT